MTLSLLLFAYLIDALPNGIALRPPMGWNSWNMFACSGMNEKNMLATARGMKAQQLDNFGYTFVNADDCWQSSRMANGTIVPDAKSFPNGLQPLIDEVHKLGFKFGLYSDRGPLTCQGRPGSLHYEAIDAQTYADWGVDYLKEDSCYATQDHTIAMQQYATMRDALNATGRPIVFSLCGWESWYAPRGATLGNLWRISGDVTNFDSMISAININAPLSKYASAGSFNDPDMLLGSDASAARYLTPTQSRTQFSMWSVMMAPLLLGGNAGNLTKWDYETYTNKEVIAVDQDDLCIQGERVAGVDLDVKVNTTNVWARKLTHNARAFVFINVGANPVDVVCDASCLKAAGVFGRDVVVRDVWLHKIVNKVAKMQTFTAKKVAADGGSQMFVFSVK